MKKIRHHLLDMSTQVPEPRHLHREYIAQDTVLGEDASQVRCGAIPNWFDPAALPVHPQVQLLTTS